HPDSGFHPHPGLNAGITDGFLAQKITKRGAGAQLPPGTPDLRDKIPADRGFGDLECPCRYQEREGVRTMKSRNFLAIVLAAGFAVMAGPAAAAGAVSQLSGTLSVRKADG